MEGLKYIGREINLKTIRSFILDESVNEDDVILLNPKNFDDVVLEHREVYQEGITVPFYFLGVLIKEGRQNEILVDRVLLKKGINSIREIPENDNEYYNGEEVFRCGYCGNVVDFDGAELEPFERSRKIRILEKFGREVIVHHRHGKCCRDKWHQ